MPGSPNLLLYIGNGTGGGTPPPPPPTFTACGASITLNGTKLTSPGYPYSYDNDLACYYNIDTQSAMLAVGVEFNFFDVAWTPFCSCDVLQAFDGTSTADTLVAKLCGNTIPDTVYSTGQNMYLAFTTDESEVRVGFEATIYFYDAATIPTNASPPPSCDFNIIQNGTSVSSPNYPSEYFNCISCSTSATAPQGEVVKLSFSFFDVEDSPNCTYDKLAIYNGNSADDPLISELCGTTIPAPVYSPSNQMFMEFSSDSTVNGTGYFGTVVFIPESEVPTVPPTAPPPPSCDDVIITQNGTSVSSPNYPSAYFNSINCSTSVTAPPDQAVKLSFSVFDVEDSSTCSYDKLAIYNGNSADDPLITELCGTTIPAPVYSPSNQMYMEFSSDGTVNGDGYFGTVVFIPESEVPTVTVPPTAPSIGCGSLHTDLTGNMTTPGYPNNYPDNSVCTAAIHSIDPAKTITIIFNDFNVENECFYDNLQVHDGLDDTAEQIANLCGNELPPPVSSTGPDMYVVFHSDDSYNEKGIHATYTIN